MNDVPVGVLAMQGAFEKHIKLLKSIGQHTIEVKGKEQLFRCKALIIPGGESTAITLQLERQNLLDALVEFTRQKPTFGTCAGLILMAKHVKSRLIKSLDLLDIAVERNAYGSQYHSFQAPIEISISQQEKKADFSGIFIRAPAIVEVGLNVKVLASYKKKPILVQQGKYLGATFHPELTDDPSIHRHFLSFINRV